MAVNASTVSVRLPPDAGRRVAKAASLLRQSRSAFLQRVGDESARRLLRDWAVARYRQGDTTFSQLAEESGLGVEEIMAAMEGDGRDEALDAFLASCGTVADSLDLPGFVGAAREAVAALRTPAFDADGDEVERGVRDGREDGGAPGHTNGMAWRVEDDRLVLLRATDEYRAAAQDALATFGMARAGARGGSGALAREMAEQMTAGFLLRSTVEQFSKWCHSEGPGYRRRAQAAAQTVSTCLFGRVIPVIDSSPAGNDAWASLGVDRGSSPSLESKR
jgi:hypothetical protein